jgi:hypothetical protein
MRAGHWVFASGLLPTKFGSAARPLSGEPRWTTEFRSLFARGQEVLRAEPIPSTPGEFAAAIRSELQTMGALVREAGIKVE